jgi:hypothetical protein
MSMKNGLHGCLEVLPKRDVHGVGLLRNGQLTIGSVYSCRMIIDAHYPGCHGNSLNRIHTFYIPLPIHVHDANCHAWVNLNDGE